MSLAIGMTEVEETKRINWHLNPRSLDNERIVGQFIEDKLGRLAIGLRNEKGTTGYNRRYLIEFLARHYRHAVTNKDGSCNFNALSVEQVKSASWAYHQMIYLDKDSTMSSVYANADMLEDLQYLWEFLWEFRQVKGVEIPDLVAPRGDRYNLRMVMWMFLEIAARAIESGEWKTIKL